jgi:ubiquinone/menaquinone biosynthesis C-methylase UbiE
LKNAISFALFNLGADIYSWFTAQPTWRKSCAELAERIADLPSPLVADLGCGPGVSTIQLARTLPATRLVGLDRAPRMLDEARRRCPRTGPAAAITWLLADATSLPFASATLDACTGHSFLYLVSDRGRVLAEVRRVLRPGGRLVLMEPNARPVTPQRVLALSHDPRHLVSVSLWRPFSQLHGRFTSASLTSTLERAGFVRCSIRETLNGLGLLASAEVPSPRSLE